ncbi:MAG: helix-turn-helix domain-containing protein [Solirubrobacteraceae bacterium]|nr:helix-turn-helix domain-containing protein [Solirubrobacteraceae bacterium]
MTPTQANTLGQVFKTARTGRGLSVIRLAERLAVNESWLIRLEGGRYTTPNPAMVARLAEHLEIDPASIDQITGGLLADSLPSVRTYFRSHDGLSDEALDEIEHALKEIRTKYGAPDQPGSAGPAEQIGGRP